MVIVGHNILFRVFSMSIPMIRQRLPIGILDFEAIQRENFEDYNPC